MLPVIGGGGVVEISRSDDRLPRVGAEMFDYLTNAIASKVGLVLALRSEFLPTIDDECSIQRKHQTTHYVEGRLPVLQAVSCRGGTDWPSDVRGMRSTAIRESL